MANGATTSGHVFVSYAHADLSRVEKLLEYLKTKNLAVWWDDDITIGRAFRSEIDAALQTASAIVVIWTETSITRQFVLDEADVGQSKGILLPVVLDAGLVPPIGFRQLQNAKLERWTGGDHPELNKLVDSIRELIALGPSKALMPTLSRDANTISMAQGIVGRMQGLTFEIRRLGDVLASDAPSIVRLRGALDEVGKTYRAVSGAILSFKNPAAQPTISAGPFLALEGSDLRSSIAAGRGHCHNIDNYYYSGLRDALQAKVSEGKLSSTDMDQIDTAFRMLAQGDMDLFEPLERIGELLSNESRAVATQVLAGQQDAARQRIVEGRMKLQPLEDGLGNAMQDLQRIESSLGYVSPVSPD
jgi:hypothetical protein